tara:strand:- start:1842 stop:2819 length:978 start_codon:yes stop_codon:yes gene_type:complete
VNVAEKFNFGVHLVEQGEVVSLAGWETHQSVESALAYCKKITESHYENFVVVNKFTPPEYVQHIQNIYAFSRYGDDLGDDAPFDNETRWKLLDTWEHDLSEAARDDWNGSPKHPILIAVQITARECKIPLEPFWKLIQAFKMDQIKTRFANFDELREYCYFSADPVGHLFLYVYGHDDEKLRELSDRTCTALQLANHWQDIARDLDQDRIYLPEETMIKHGYTYDDYHARVADERWRALMKEEVDRAQEWFDAGVELWQHCDPRLAVDLMMFSWGGQAVLESIRKSNYNTWKKRPTVSKFKQLKLLFRAKRAWKAAHRNKKCNLE